MLPIVIGGGTHNQDTKIQWLGSAIMQRQKAPEKLSVHYSKMTTEQTLA